MFKLMAIYYQPEAGERFDEEYYVKKHLPMVKKTLPGIVSTHYAKAMPTPAGGKPPIVGVGIVSWGDKTTFQKAMSSPDVQKIRDDHHNYCTGRSDIVTVMVEEV